MDHDRYLQSFSSYQGWYPNTISQHIQTLHPVRFFPPIDNIYLNLHKEEGHTSWPSQLLTDQTQTIYNQNNGKLEEKAAHDVSYKEQTCEHGPTSFLQKEISLYLAAPNAITAAVKAEKSATLVFLHTVKASDSLSQIPWGLRPYDVRVNAVSFILPRQRIQASCYVLHPTDVSFVYKWFPKSY